MRIFPPLLSKVSDEGIQQGLFSPACPASELGEIIIHMVLSLRESIGMVLASHDRQEAFRAIQARVKAYARCVERILGMEAGRLGVPHAGAMDRFVQG